MSKTSVTPASGWLASRVIESSRISVITAGEHVLLLVNELELHSDVRREIIREIGYGHDKHQVFIMLVVSFFRADGHGLLGACLYTQDGILETWNNLSTPELKLEGLSAGRGIKDLAAFEPSRVMNFYRVA